MKYLYKMAYRSSLINIEQLSQGSPVVIPRRHMCTLLERSLAFQLAFNIEYIYRDLMKDGFPSLPTRGEVDEIFSKVMGCEYVLSPLRIEFINKDDLSSFLRDKLTYHFDMQIVPLSDGSRFAAIMPNESDVLVYMGLSKLLLQRSYRPQKLNCYRISELGDSLFYKNLIEMGKGDRLYKLDLASSLYVIPKSFILDRVPSLVGEGYVYNLISNYLFLPIIDTTGYDCSYISKGGMPLAGEITRVLFNIALMEIFDRKFPERFPGIPFTRMINEVYILHDVDKHLIFNEKVAAELLKDLGLEGTIDVIEPGDDPLSCSLHGKVVYLDDQKQVNLCYPHEYY